MSGISNEELMERIIGLEDKLEEVLKLLTPAKSKKKPKVTVDDDMTRLWKYYKQFKSLPQHKTFTQNAQVFFRDAIAKHDIDDIKEAIEFASTVEWAKAKLGEKWYTAGWVLKNIDKYMEGGKYRVEPEWKKRQQLADDVTIIAKEKDVNVDELF